MTELINRPETAHALFQTAHAHHAQALAQLDQGELRQAAALAWDAALAATNALLLARSGRHPEDLRETDGLMQQFARDNPSLRPLLTHYDLLQSYLLHQTGLYDCPSVLAGALAVDIRDAGSYLREVEKLTAQPPRPGGPTVKELFQAAHDCHAQALKWLEQGQSRAAARKAWDAAWLATNGLILARTGQELEDMWQAHTLLPTIAPTEPEVKGLARRYSTLAGGLFDGCLSDGICGPPEAMAEDVAYAHSYIKDAARLAGV